MWTEVVLAWIKLYTGLFSLRVIFALLHLQSASSYLQFAHTQLWQKRYYLWQWHLPSLKFALNNEGEKGENKTGVNISLNTVADFLESNFLASSMMYGQYIWKKKCMHILQINLFFLFFFNTSICHNLAQLKIQLLNVMFIRKLIALVSLIFFFLVKNAN